MKKILIVEDEKNLIQIYKDKLTDVGYSVDIVNTGLSAVDGQVQNCL